MVANADSLLLSTAGTSFKFMVLSEGTAAGRNHMSTSCPGDFPAPGPCQHYRRSARGKLALTSFMRKREVWAVCLPVVWIFFFFFFWKAEACALVQTAIQTNWLLQTLKNLTRQEPHYCSQVSSMQCVTSEDVFPQCIATRVTHS